MMCSPAHSEFSLVHHPAPYVCITNLTYVYFCEDGEDWMLEPCLVWLERFIHFLVIFAPFLKTQSFAVSLHSLIELGSALHTSINPQCLSTLTFSGLPTQTFSPEVFPLNNTLSRWMISLHLEELPGCLYSPHSQIYKTRRDLRILFHPSPVALDVLLGHCGVCL